MSNQLQAPPFDPQQFERLFELFGGRQKFIEEAQKSAQEFRQFWEQDADKIGRVLKAHLVVEHYLTVFLRAANPNLGDIERFRFNDKVEMIGGHENLVVLSLKPALKKLNSIRNKMAHRLRFELTDADCEPLRKQPFFSALYPLYLYKASKTGSPTLNPSDHVEIIEEFSKFAASMLQAGGDPNAHLYKEAFEKNH